MIRVYRINGKHIRRNTLFITWYGTLSDYTLERHYGKGVTAEHISEAEFDQCISEGNTRITFDSEFQSPEDDLEAERRKQAEQDEHDLKVAQLTADMPEEPKPVEEHGTFVLNVTPLAD